MIKNELYIPKVFSRLVDFAVTVIIWVYFTLGFILFFSPFYLYSYLFSKNRKLSFQALNHKFYQGFFLLFRIFAPYHKWDINENVRNIKSSVIVCNHLSYLDPLIMISLYKQHTTIVKARFFNYLIFGKMITVSGYIPSSTMGGLGNIMIQRIEKIPQFLQNGGNLFIFPEGTRSKTGKIGEFNKGAFKIAKLAKAPIKVISIQNTDKLFKPGKFFFQTMLANKIQIKLENSIEPDYSDSNFSLNGLINTVYEILEKK
ncbi:MAG: hypothetical protein B6I31_02940 [Desulfobacteraceae bacterium 4572_19]|nr:MAG: hypothetical protein B6I31_02940 [Desulfobacteraceae bacterium 4572_19]